MNDQELDAWLAGLDADARAHFSSAVTLAVSVQCSEVARVECERAEAGLVAAIGRAERAREYLNRTTATMVQAIQLHAKGRS